MNHSKLFYHFYSFIFYLLIGSSIISSCQNNSDLSNTKWKYCEGEPVADMIRFAENESMYVRGDSIFLRPGDIFDGSIEQISTHYGERRLHAKNNDGTKTIYCEK